MMWKPWSRLSVGIVLLALCTAGCSDPRFEEKWQKRQTHIGIVFNELEERERACGPNLANLNQLIDKDIQRQQAHLAASLDRIRTAMEEEAEDWPQDLERTREEVAERMAGDVDDIDETIPRMFY